MHRIDIGRTKFQIESCKDYKEWIYNLHKLGLQNAFPNNKPNDWLIDNLDISTLKNPEEILQIKEKYEAMKLSLKGLYSQIYMNDKKIILWTKDDIKAWLLKLQENKELISDLKYEIMSIICRGIDIVLEYSPKESQMIAFFTSIEFFKKNKTLLQVKPGEGKTLIIAMITIFLCLWGYKVDIVTSSKVLAERDSEKNQKLYNLFNLTASHNCFSNDGPKNCYSSDIIYGDVGSFAGDYLNHHWRNKDTRGSRKFEETVCIIDEVDNLLLDNSDHITMLSSNFYGFEPLSYFMRVVWYFWLQFSSNIMVVDKKAYYVPGLIEKEVKDSQGIINKVRFLIIYFAIEIHCHK